MSIQTAIIVNAEKNFSDIAPGDVSVELVKSRRAGKDLINMHNKYIGEAKKLGGQDYSNKKGIVRFVEIRNSDGRLSWGDEKILSALINVSDDTDSIKEIIEKLCLEHLKLGMKIQKRIDKK
jgi:hypothetical protein